MVYQVNYILTGPQRTNQSHILPWNARFPRISRSLFQIGSFDSARTELATVQPTHALLARLHSILSASFSFLAWIIQRVDGEDASKLTYIEGERTLRVLQDIDMLQFDAKLKWFSLARNNSIQYR